MGSVQFQSYLSRFLSIFSVSRTPPKYIMRHVKIVATIGPVSSSTDVLGRLLRAGMNVARVNMSHGTREWHRATITKIRHIAKEQERPVAVLMDLQGPKIRIGMLPDEGVVLEREQEVALVPDAYSQTTRGTSSGRMLELPVEYARFAQGVQAGQRILIDDGNLHLEAIAVQYPRVQCRVLAGGRITSRKGINFPGLSLDIQGFTEKDALDLQTGLALDVDFVALSFVRTPEDITGVQHLIHQAGKSTPVIAKIERPEAVNDLERLVERADGIMVARGDLALEMSPEEVPLLQKRMIALANRMGKIVITATQMLESMTRNPSPTRAEASDVANAVFDGTDGVMLSAETSTGKYPEESIQVMDRIIQKTESDTLRQQHPVVQAPVTYLSTPEAVCQAAVSLSRAIGAQAIVVFTESGHTALLVGKNRPAVPIVALTPSQSITRQLSLAWGVVPLEFSQVDDTDQRINQAQDRLKTAGLLAPGQLIVIITGERLGHAFGTNLVKVHVVV
jgi:pyruvate kinase